MNDQQVGLLQNTTASEIVKPVNNTGVRLFKETSDGKYYIKKSDGTVEEFSVALTGTMQLIGIWDASGNTYPIAGDGSGLAGAIQKGDVWLISVAGTLNGIDVKIGDELVALTDAPGQIGANWFVLNKNIGFVPENVANKAADYSVINGNKYPSLAATELRYAKTLFQDVVSVNNVDGGEDTLYSNTVSANTLHTNGGSVIAHYAINMANTANAKTIRLYFAGTKIFESAVDFSATGAKSLDLKTEIVRVDSTHVRCITSYVGDGISEADATVVAAQDFTIDNAILLTGEGVATSDITALLGKGTYSPNT